MSSENRKTILLVEDEVILAMAEKMTLEKYGYYVILAYSGQSAIDVLVNQKTIDIILMDIDLGKGIDGTEAAAIILQDNDIPVVFLSSHTEPEVVEKTEKITSYGYVVKNSSITVLDASIKMAFKLFNAKLIIQKQNDAYKNAKEEAEINEEKFRLIFEKSRDAIGLSINGNHILVNTSYVNMFGYNSIEEIYSINARELIALEDRDRISEYIRLRYSKQSAPDNYEALGIMKDGTVFLMEVAVSTYKYNSENITLVIIRNINNRRNKGNSYI